MKKGCLIYLVGISGSGKSTLADEAAKVLRQRGRENLQVIDGDTIRNQFGEIFGYTFEERMKCNRVVRVVIQYLVDNGINVMLSQVGGYAEMRQAMRKQFSPQFFQVYVRCSQEECARRDVKGYYKTGIENLNGKSTVFDEPEDSELVIDTQQHTISEGTEQLVAFLEEHIYGIPVHHDR